MRNADRTRARTLACATALLFTATSSTAQSWRTIDAFRLPVELDTLRVRVDYTVGALRVQRGSDSLLYRAQLRYDSERFHPVRSFDASSGTLTVGVRGDDKLPLRGSKGKEEGMLTLTLSPSQPIDLELQLGATDSDLELGGLPLSRLMIGSGVSDLSITFSERNPVPLREMAIDAGIAHVRIDNLGNANAERVRISGSVGDVDIDMGGRWSGLRELDVMVTFGSATVRLPRSVGVRIRHSRLLGTFDGAGFTQEGDTYVNRAWESAEQKVSIDARTTFGSFDVVWIDR